MPRIKTAELVPGMITAEDVFNYNNQLILPRGLELTDKSITKLEFYSILYVNVEEFEEKEAPAPEETTEPSAKVPAEQIEAMEEELRFYFEESYNEVMALNGANFQYQQKVQATAALS